MGEVIYARHGLRQGKGIFDDGRPGSQPKPLTEVGAAQAEKLGEILSIVRGIDKIFTSPVLRAVQTANVIGLVYAKLTGSTIEIIHEPLLTERGNGVLQGQPIPDGMTFFEFRRQQAERGYPDIESYVSVMDRLYAFLDRHLHSETIIAVTHQDVIHAAIAEAYGISETSAVFNPGVQEGSATVISYWPRQNDVKREGVVREQNITGLNERNRRILSSINAVRVAQA